MKKAFKNLILYCLAAAMLLSVTSCHLDILKDKPIETEQGTPEAATPQSTPETTVSQETPEATTPEVTTPEETAPQETTASQETTTLTETTTLEETTPPEETTTSDEITIPEESTIPQETPPAPPHEHIFVNGACACGEIFVLAKASIYDNDKNGDADIFYFSPCLPERFRANDAISVSAEKYDKKDYFGVRYASVSGHHKFWYCQEGKESYMNYQIEVPEAGTYELAIYTVLEYPNRSYGAKYTVNDVYSVQTSFDFTEEELAQTCESGDTMSAYMFGIIIELKAGVNTVKIEAASNTASNQLFCAFYFAKITK